MVEEWRLRAGKPTSLEPSRANAPAARLGETALKPATYGSRCRWGITPSGRSRGCTTR